MGELPRSAATILSFEVQKAESHRVPIANKNPQDQPANNESSSQEKTNKSEPAVAKILLNPALIPIAKSKPITPPMTPATAAITTPSMTASALASDLVTPIARMTPNSLRLDSANINTMVRTNNTPAAMVKVPNTRNIPDITPEDCAAALAASSLTAVNWRLMSSLVERWSNQVVRFSRNWLISESLVEFNEPPAKISIERSSLPAEDNCSPYSREIKPNTTSSNSASDSIPASSLYSPS